jgi:hypothetical protein
VGALPSRVPDLRLTLATRAARQTRSDEPRSSDSGVPACTGQAHYYGQGREKEGENLFRRGKADAPKDVGKDKGCAHGSCSARPFGATGECAQPFDVLVCKLDARFCFAKCGGWLGRERGLGFDYLNQLVDLDGSLMSSL